MFAIGACAALAGCLGTSRPPVKAWTVEPAVSDAASRPPVRLDELNPPPFRSTRLGGVTVLAPYDSVPMRVKRADGSLAEDLTLEDIVVTGVKVERCSIYRSVNET